MKLALCLEYPIGLRGGVSVLVETLLVGFVERGHQVLLVSPDTPETLHDSEAGKRVAMHLPWYPHPARPANARDLASRLAGAKVELAHFHFGGNYGWGNRFPECCPVSFLRDFCIPCVSTVHRADNFLDGFCGPERSTILKLLLLPLAYCGKMQQLHRVRAEIAVSQNNVRKLRRWYPLLRNRYVQIYHSRLRDDLPVRGSQKRQPIILNVGHLAWQKGQLVLAEAFALIAMRNPEWKLQFAGHDSDGRSTRQLQNFAKEHCLEDRILVLGQRSDAFDLMQCASIYVQPSYGEALGLALQEALFCGCPAIGTRAGGIPELIEEDRTGLLVEPGNAEQLGCALQRLIRDEGLRDAWGRAASASIRRRGMTAASMVKRHLELYESVTARN